MLGNCEKMVLISSTTNEWSQNNHQIDDPKGSFSNNMVSVAAAAAAGIGSDQKVSVLAQDHQLQQQQQKQQQQQQEALRCPRCDSTNTKFCYYNNYSLTQPRHFCKACKRYWTRGGTLRNVPVGGGCRKNKRVKRPPNNNSSSTSVTSLSHNNGSLESSVNSGGGGGGGGGVGGGLSSLSSSAQIHDMITSASNHVNHHHHPLFYGLPTNHSPNSDINFPFSRYDLQNPPQINGLGLGFSSGLVHNMNSMNIHNNTNNNNNHSQNNNTKQIFQDLISSNPLLSNYSTTTSTTTTTTSPTISSLLASSFHQMKGANNTNFQSLLPSYEDDLHMKGSGQNGHGGMFMKGVKMESEGQNRSIDHHHHHQEWNNPPSQNQMDHQTTVGSSSDGSILWSNAGANLGAWLDQSNSLGSSVPSLI